LFYHCHVLLFKNDILNKPQNCSYIIRHRYHISLLNFMENQYINNSSTTQLFFSYTVFYLDFVCVCSFQLTVTFIYHLTEAGELNGKKRL